MNDRELVTWLLGPGAVRERAAQVLALAEAGRLPSWSVDGARLGACAQAVAAVTRAAYPELKVPVHGRMRHFDVGGVARSKELEAALAGLDATDKAKAKLDLIVVSVLLDAGAGPQWKYVERETGGVYSRSEGLAVASLRMFLAGMFSSDPRRPHRADEKGLMAIGRDTLARGFQVTSDNPLVGLDGRVELMNRLGRAVPHPGALFDDMARWEGAFPAKALLGIILTRLGNIWPGRLSLAGTSLGDTWICEALGASLAERLVPFHKLSQWLTYSMIEVFEEAGQRVDGLDELTGLAEYRNGGLFIDSGVLVPRDPKMLERAHLPGDQAVVEWRALTVALLDRVAPLVRQELGPAAAKLPLASILEGGTWATGRKLAAEQRPGGGPPLRIESDGTVF